MPAAGEGSVTSIGREAEDTAYNYLAGQGLKLLARNYRIRRGEIDLVMQDKGCIVFIEVRYRRHPRFGSALESIDKRKQDKIVATARHYLQHHEGTTEQCARFDVITVSPGRDALRIEWIKDAFRT